MGLSFPEQLQRLLQPIYNRISTIVCCGLIQSTNDTKNIQTVKVNLLQNELKDNVENIQQFGFTSNPPDNSEAVVLSSSGIRSHSIIIATGDSRYRVKSLKKGEMAIYNQNGDKVVLTENKIQIFSDNIEIGKTSFKALVNAEFKELFNRHQHNYMGFVGTGTPTLGSTSTPVSLQGADVGLPPMGALPVAPPTGLLGDTIGDTHLTQKTKAE